MHSDETELRTARTVNVDSVFRWPSFSHAVLADGHIYLSGVLGTVGTELPQLADGETAGQTRQALRNLEQVLASCGASLEDLVKVTVYLCDIETFLEMGGAYMEFVTTQPARVTVGLLQPQFGRCCRDRRHRLQVTGPSPRRICTSPDRTIRCRTKRGGFAG